jgi:superfamily II DNA or RNA helicase
MNVTDNNPGTCELPECWSAGFAADGNPGRQLLVPQTTAALETLDGERWAVASYGRWQVLEPGRSYEGTQPALQLNNVLIDGGRPDFGSAAWIGDLAVNDPSQVLRSLDGAFSFVADDPNRGQSGLRLPQLGAVHTVLGYWTTSSSHPGTVVMPTGTGKTETMLALFAAAQPDRLLVVVPSDALRGQLAGKFESFGVLQRFGVVAPTALRPVVGQVQHRFASTSAARDFARACNVIIATPSALDASEPEVRLALLGSCSHLFIDEAHHVAAATWQQIRDEFAGKPVTQFTATPFREDGRHLGGRLIYAFPLREAQKQGYFSKINYHSIVDFEDPDRAIALKAIEELRKDLAAGRDHLLMARVRYITRAADVHALYTELAPDLTPVVLHSRVSNRGRRAALKSIRTRESRIIICVDMLGEGFDLPALKVAAIHDPHKSSGVTLQFIGRFARVAGVSIGDATVVVARPDLGYDDKLRRLYAEDADWNLIIQDLSESAVNQQEEISEFEAGFGSLPEEVLLRNLLPKMSTVVYRTRVEAWDPQAVFTLYSEEELLTVPIGINEKERVAWFVTEERTPVRWGDLHTVQELKYELYVLYWDAARQLLYINSSNNDSLHDELAKAVCGEKSKRITGENVYRVMAQVNRLVPTNVGVLDFRNRARRFSMHVGADVTEGFPVAEAQTKTKTNIFAYGFEDGGRVSIGASLKGRVWSYRAADTLKEWVDWCDHVGGKLIDDTISVDEVMRNFIRPKVVEERPPLVALALEWPWEVFRSTTEEVRIARDGSDWPLVDANLRITSFSSEGPIPFSVSTPAWTAEYEAILRDGKITFRTGGPEANIVSRWTSTPLTAYLEKQGLTFHFEQDALVVPPGILLKPDRDIAPFDAERLNVLDWSDVKLRKESQGPGRDADSIQARVIQHTLTLEDWDLVVDDDGTGEIADIVAMRADGDRLVVRLTHCKYSSDDRPGARVEDLYEVCGQAQKSAQWRRNVPLLFQHLIRREKRRKERQGRSGIEKGTASKLYDLEEKARLLRPEFTIAIAQPGVSKARVSRQQLELLASTEVYVYETSNSSLEVLCSS